MTGVQTCALPIFIVSGTLTSVGDDPQLMALDTSITQGNDYFNEGILTFLTGPNTNVSREIRLWSNQTYSMWRRFPAAMAAGHTYKAVKGDNKTEDTCRDIFANILNFGGFTDIPGINKVFALPTRT